MVTVTPRGTHLTLTYNFLWMFFIVRPSSSQPILVCRENMSNMTKLQPMFNQTAEYCASGNFRGEKDWWTKILPNYPNRFCFVKYNLCEKKRNKNHSKNGTRIKKKLSFVHLKQTVWVTSWSHILRLGGFILLVILLILFMSTVSTLRNLAVDVFGVGTFGCDWMAI